MRLSNYVIAVAEAAKTNLIDMGINENKITLEEDNKILSIPFQGACLNKDNAIESTDVHCGSVIHWKETNSYWIVYSQFLSELAYFRGAMRRCEDDTIDVNGRAYRYYLKGPSEQGIDWQKSKRFIFNELNYTVEIYISNNSETKQFFQRFAKCKIKDKNFEVQAVDELSTKGILTVYLKEDYSNNWQKSEDPDTPGPDEPINPNAVRIDGDLKVYPYDIKTYNIVNMDSGQWTLSNNKAKIVSETASSVTLKFVTGKSGFVDLTYTRGIYSHTITIQILSL